MISKRHSVLVTGGFGYLGGRICSTLVKEGFNVLIGTRKTKADLPVELASCATVVTNFQEPDSLLKACNGVDTIIHLAAANAQECVLDPRKAMLVNGLGVFDLLQAAKKNKVKNFIYFSTVHVYGSLLLGCINEKSLTKPLHDYSLTHYVAENYVIRECEQGYINGVVLRVSNAVGAPLTKDGGDWGLVVNDLCKQVVTSGRMKLLSNRSLLRDYVPISDVCLAVNEIISSSSILNKANGEIINVSSGQSVSLEGISDLIAGRAQVVLGYDPKIIFNNESGESDASSFTISNKKLRSIGINPHLNLLPEIDDLLRKAEGWFNV